MLKQYQIPQNDYFSIHWFCKPGHSQTVLHLVQKSLKKHKINAIIRATAGKGDIGYTIKGLSTFIKHLKLLIGQGLNPNKAEGEICEHVRELYTTLEFEISDHRIKKANLVSKNHFNFHEDEKFLEGAFNVRKKKEIITLLDKAQVSKTTKDKICKIYTLANEGLLDHAQYVFFYQLRPYLNHIIQYISNYVNGRNNKISSIQELTKELDEFTEFFRYAYQNRFGESHVYTEHGEHSIFYQGGIQNVLNCYDGVFRILSSLFADEHLFSFALVKGNTNIISNAYSIRLNYQYLNIHVC